MKATDLEICTGLVAYILQEFGGGEIKASMWEEAADVVASQRYWITIPADTQEIRQANALLKTEDKGAAYGVALCRRYMKAGA